MGGVCGLLRVEDGHGVGGEVCGEKGHGDGGWQGKVHVHAAEGGEAAGCGFGGLRETGVWGLDGWMAGFFLWRLP